MCPPPPREETREGSREGTGEGADVEVPIRVRLLHVGESQALKAQLWFHLDATQRPHRRFDAVEVCVGSSERTDLSHCCFVASTQG